MPRWHTTIQNPSPCETNKGNHQKHNGTMMWWKKVGITCETIPIIFPQIHSLEVVAGWATWKLSLNINPGSQLHTYLASHPPTTPKYKRNRKLGVCFLQDQGGLQKVVTY
jgi:hypothetical protein